MNSYKKPFCNSIFFFYPGFYSRSFTTHRTERKGVGSPYKSFLLLPSISQILGHELNDDCKELTSRNS